MRKPLTLLGLGLVAALTACSSPAPSTTRPAVDAVAATQRPCGRHVVADDSANGSTVCVAKDSDVSIMLTTVGNSSWSSPTVTGNALGPAMGLPTPYGRVGWQFRAIAVGQAEISTTRPGCPPPAKCHAVRYHLYVTVR